MGILLHLSFLVARTRWWMLPIFVALSFSVSGRLVHRKILVRVLIVGLGLANFLEGPILCDWLLSG